MIAIIIGSVSLGHAKDYGDFKGAVYVRNYDGDTITFNLFGYPSIIGQEVGIRVNGIDTPEIRGKCEQEKRLALEAKAQVHKLLSNAQTIDLVNMSRGKYFRIVADVIVDGTNIIHFLLQNQLAVLYDGGKKTEDWCQAQPE